MAIDKINKILMTILTTQYNYVDYGCYELVDQDVAGICEKIIENPNITKLGLWMNYITDDSVPHIINMLQSPLCVIQHIDLSDNKLTKQGIEKILDILPALKRHVTIKFEKNPGFSLHVETYLQWRRPDNLFP